MCVLQMREVGSPVSIVKKREKTQDWETDFKIWIAVVKPHCTACQQLKVLSCYFANISIFIIEATERVIMKLLLLDDNSVIINRQPYHWSLIMQFTSPASEKATANPH